MKKVKNCNKGIFTNKRRAQQTFVGQNTQHRTEGRSLVLFHGALNSIWWWQFMCHFFLLHSQTVSTQQQTFKTRSKRSSIFMNKHFKLYYCYCNILTGLCKTDLKSKKSLFEAAVVTPHRWTLFQIGKGINSPSPSKSYVCCTNVFLFGPFKSLLFVSLFIQMVTYRHGAIFFMLSLKHLLVSDPNMAMLVFLRHPVTILVTDIH